MDEATSIQLAFPSEPSWSTVSDVVLIQLVEAHEGEPSCAEAALVELRTREHLETKRLCRGLLSSGGADKWLRAGALGVLLSLDVLRGLDFAMTLIETCELELVEEIIEALNYEHQGDMSSVVHRHPIVQLVMERLAQPSGREAGFGQLFVENFGAYQSDA